MHWTMSGMPTYANQDRLLPLPLPLLEETLERYLRSCKPLLSSAEYSKTKQAVRAFAASPGPVLQQRLQERAAATAAAGSHWLEAWWDHFAYLSSRVSLLADAQSMFTTMFDAKPCASRHRRAARMLHAAVDFYVQLQAGSLAPDCLDTRGRIPLCMDSLRNLFASSRVPGVDCDSIVTAAHPPRHAVVFCNGHAYSLQVLLGGGGGSGSSSSSSGTGEPEPWAAVPVQALEECLVAIEADAFTRGSNAYPLPALSLLPRDQWAKHRTATRNHTPGNADGIDAIESALIALTLELGAPADLAEHLHACHEGIDGRSVWFDKPISLLVFADGKAGVHMEHAHFDAATPARLMGFVARCVSEAEAADPAHTAPPVVSLSPAALSLAWHQIELTLPPSAQAATKTDAPAAFRELSDRTVLAPMRFEGGGRQELRLLRGASPDSVVQMALQLAQGRDQGEFVATYEAATTRRFRHGRTETVRSCSTASVAFARAMDDPSTDDAGKLQALIAALREHGDWLMRCSSGKGVDRHLMGLRILVAGAGLPTPDLFTDAAYARTSTWKLSTSNNSNPGRGPSYLDMGGFGPPTVESYGVAYQIQEHAIQFVASSDRRCTTRDAARFATAVSTALRDIFDLIARLKESKL